MGARERARDAKKIEELGTMKNALRMYTTIISRIQMVTGLLNFLGQI